MQALVGKSGSEDSNLLVGMNINNDARKRALLLHYAGERVYEIYEAEKGESGNTYANTKEVLTKYFEPKTNIQIEIYNFRSCKQKEGQSLDEFVTELRQLSKNCGFTDVDKEILSQVIQHCSSSRFRRRALREPDKSLTEILDIGRTLELTDKHAASMENESISAVRYNKNQQTTQRDTPLSHKETTQDRDSKKTCKNCGGAYPHSGSCPAQGKTCNYCKKLNHFKRVCMKLKKKEPINTVQERAPANDSRVSDSSSKDEYCYGVRFDEDSHLKNENLFKGIGKQRDTTVKLHIDETVKPVAQKQRRTPFHLRDKVANEIEKLLKEDVIEKVEDTPTPWVSPIVTPPKKEPGAIRLCVDMREPNKAIQRERHQMPTIDELINDLNGAKVFSKLDLRTGYHQLELHEDSRYITTFSTHIGLYRYKRLNLGICSASEIFQEAIHNVIRDIPGAKNIADNIIIFGTNQKQHDIALEATLQRLEKKGLTLNREKCEFNKDEVEFFGLVFNASGVSPDPKKVDSLKKTQAPVNVSEVKSFLGMMNYSARFIPNYAMLSEPLRRLTQNDATWTWSTEQENAFIPLKQSLTADTIIAYFDPSKEIEIIVDASPVGLGAMLEQDGRIVAFASRALTDTESRYSQTEREALAIVWASQEF
ncbi:Hypothetical predicted protein [Paramuricea clavata]|uniref:Uncharacterized protein n=1 Tax=Paramuricea clavata TaxID=317549 RepID=A0A6S7JP13_PARCT|nr:Hypothetical predicted protein [Paramuricea clavata]